MPPPAGFQDQATQDTTEEKSLAPGLPITDRSIPAAHKAEMRREIRIIPDDLFRSESIKKRNSRGGDTARALERLLLFQRTQV